MKKQLFKADYNKKLYKIEIEVCENGNLFTASVIDKDYKITYESMIGTLELCKATIIRDKTEGENNKPSKTKKK